MEEISIPEFIDSPPQILFMEADDLFPIFLGLMVGLFIKFIWVSPVPVLIGFILGCVFARVYVGYKRRRLPGTLKAIAFSYSGVVPLNKKWLNGLLQRVDA